MPARTQGLSVLCGAALAVFSTLALPGLAEAQAQPVQPAPAFESSVPVSPPPSLDPASPAAPQPPLYMAPPVGLPYPTDHQAPVRYELRPRTGLAIAGGAVFGGLYLASTIAASFLDDKSLAVPVVGPFIEMGMLSANSGSSASSLAPLHFALFMNGLTQAAGVAMLIAGLATKQKVALYRPRFCVSPYTAQAGAGIVASGRF